MSPSPTTLTGPQAHALFDILVHHELYAEISSFRWPDAIDHYGYPFRKEDGTPTRSPLLQNLLNKFALRLPGLNSVSDDFWEEKVRTLVAKLGEAELSESYDKGTIGSRRALATAISSLLEYVARGVLGGHAKKEVDRGRVYNTTKAEEILQAWEDGLQEVIYGNLLDDMFDRIAETGNLEDHSPLVQAVHEYILVNLASFLHNIFVMSPDGQYLLHVIENVHRLIPYPVLRQTLRVGNAATMINGVVRLFLTKLSVTAVTNWMGWTNNTNDGMNLLQQIISQVMGWDTAEYHRRVARLEKGKGGPSDKAFAAIRDHVHADRDTHEKARQRSIDSSKSIVAVILESADPPVDTSSISEADHDTLQEYYSVLLSIRDREELTKILCKMQPDTLTSSVRDLVSAYDPIIRAVHNAVDLSDTIADAQAFLDDMIKISKPKRPTGDSSSRNNSRTSSPNPRGVTITQLDPADLPTVQDYVQLLRKHIPSSHKFMHQVAKNAPDLVQQYRDYAKACVLEFRVRGAPSTSSAAKQEMNAGSMTAALTTLFSSLSPDTQASLLPILNKHERHLSHLKSASSSRLKALISSDHPKHKRSHSHTSIHGPGMYLARWHALLDSTLITPDKMESRVRYGWEVKGVLDSGSRGRSGGGGLSGTRLGRRGSVASVVSVASVGSADGDGDVGDGKEGKDGKKHEPLGEQKVREAKETELVWEAMKGPWGELVRGMEIMGP